jgi:hypothetical protein
MIKTPHFSGTNTDRRVYDAEHNHQDIFITEIKNNKVPRLGLKKIIHVCLKNSTFI